MPTALRVGPYRIYFFSHDIAEPPHVHVDRDACSAKFWLSPTRIATNRGFSQRELRVVRDIVVQTEDRLMEAWYAHFRAGGR